MLECSCAHVLDVLMCSCAQYARVLNMLNVLDVLMCSCAQYAQCAQCAHVLILEQLEFQ